MNRITIDLGTFYNDTAKLHDIHDYINKAQELAGDGKEIILTGRAPVWMYLKIAHALHGKVRTLIYNSPVTGDVVIFDHSPD